ncbi:hypothetical protein GWI33_002325 [Rhynchophorus ferrugineus]|uniref:Uncharacterized protein n=1 Tax=Rhynchophorus ferrugineus TaxID=354439 RepID=A0A834IN26_RHYFE|nr:hypothetical protein GWI33_002325 [Rhynchophorus ferrugineus]
MNRHLRTFHPEKIEPVKISVVGNIMRCALCEHTTSKSQLIDHMQSLHNMKIEQETLKFDSLENFEIWKGNIERTTNASFVKHRGTYIDQRLKQSDIRQADIRHKIDMSSRVLTNEVENDEDNFECIKEEELHIKPEIEEPSLYIPETPMEENCDQDNLERLHLHKNMHNIQQSSITLNRLPGIRHKNDTSSRALTNEVQNDGDNFDKLYCIKQEELHIKSEIEESTPYISENPMDENSDHQEGHSIQQKMFYSDSEYYIFENATSSIAESILKNLEDRANRICTVNQTDKDKLNLGMY